MQAGAAGGKRRILIGMKWLILSVMGILMALLCALGGPAQADCGLVGTYWRAVAIDGAPVTVESNKREPHLVFSSEGRVSGSTGCNRLSGSFEQGADSFRFKQMITTKMACPPPVDAMERAFLQVLGATTAVQLSGNTLELKDAAGKVRMRLEAR
jgi:heat shock protein HslJ